MRHPQILTRYPSISEGCEGEMRLSGRDISWDGFSGRVDGERIVGELNGRPLELRRGR